MGSRICSSGSAPAIARLSHAVTALRRQGEAGTLIAGELTQDATARGRAGLLGHRASCGRIAPSAPRGGDDVTDPKAPRRLGIDRFGATTMRAPRGCARPPAARQAIGPYPRRPACAAHPPAPCRWHLHPRSRTSVALPLHSRDLLPRRPFELAQDVVAHTDGARRWASDGRCHARGRRHPRSQPRGGDLVQQRLEGVVVVPVDHRHVQRMVRQCLRASTDRHPVVPALGVRIAGTCRPGGMATAPSAVRGHHGHDDASALPPLPPWWSGFMTCRSRA